MGRGSPHDPYRFQSCDDFVCDAYGNSLGLHPSLRDYDRHPSPARKRTTVARERHQEAPMGSPYPEDLPTPTPDNAPEAPPAEPTPADGEEE